MKNSRKLVEKTLAFDSPERIPRHAWVLPWAEEMYPIEVKKLRKKYPDDIVAAPLIYKNPVRITGGKYTRGEYIDEWGCKFHNMHSGIMGIVKDPVIEKWEDLEQFQAPESTIYIDKDQINSFCKQSDKFVLAGNITRPFERFQFLRTMELALTDLIIEPDELTELLGIIHTHYCKEVEAWARTDIDAISLMDDWGTQSALLASPEVFKKYFKPMYEDYVEIARSYGKYVFMHSDGYIIDLIPEFIEIGFDALNSQIFCMGLTELSKLFKGKITFWGEIDRQELLPLGSIHDIEKAVHEVYENLYNNGGVIAQCEFGPGARYENVLKVFETWNGITINN